jgi:hypothetical protein
MKPTAIVLGFYAAFYLKFFSLKIAPIHIVLAARKGAPLPDANGLGILVMVNDEWSRSLSRQP